MSAVCKCEMPYTDTAAGRHAHRVIHGHTPSKIRRDVARAIGADR